MPELRRYGSLLPAYDFFNGLITVIICDALAASKHKLYQPITTEPVL